MCGTLRVVNFVLEGGYVGGGASIFVWGVGGRRTVRCSHSPDWTDVCVFAMACGAPFRTFCRPARADLREPSRALVVGPLLVFGVGFGADWGGHSLTFVAGF